MIGQSRKGLASFCASVSFWCLSSLKIGRKNGAVSLILVSFVLNYKCSDFFCQSAFIYKISRGWKLRTVTGTEKVLPPPCGTNHARPAISRDTFTLNSAKYCEIRLAKSLFSRIEQCTGRISPSVTLCRPRLTIRSPS